MKINFWDFLGWLAFSFLILYALLKILKIIQSPITVDLVALISIAYFIGKYAKKIDYDAKKLDDAVKKLDDNTRKLYTVFQDVEHIKHDVKELNQKCPIFK